MKCHHCRRPRVKMFIQGDLLLCSGCMLGHLTREGIISLAGSSSTPAHDGGKAHA